jgi:hypothetical protein
MYAVIFEQKLLYLGYDQLKALDVFRLKKNAELHCLQSTSDLKNLIDYKNEDFLNHEDLQDSGKVNDLFKRLEDLNNDLFVDQQKTQVDNKPAEVRYLGHKDMKPVGKGFVCVNEPCSEEAEV